jgi:DnaK suppressor protein
MRVRAAVPVSFQPFSGFVEVSMVPSSLVSSLVSSQRQHAGARWLARQLPALRDELERQRDFREEQLAHLLAHDGNGASSTGYGPRTTDGDADRALREVRALVVSGARRALADIELALARMSEGGYGRCRACGAGIPVAVLAAVPATTLCQACQLSAEGGTSGP